MLFGKTQKLPTGEWGAAVVTTDGIAVGAPIYLTHHGRARIVRVAAILGTREEITICAIDESVSKSAFADIDAPKQQPVKYETDEAVDTEDRKSTKQSAQEELSTIPRKDKRTRSPKRDRKKHGMAGTRTYAVWCSMLANHSEIVTEPWLKFGNFLADMGPRPERAEGARFVRIDESKPFCKQNCRWDVVKHKAKRIAHMRKKRQTWARSRYLTKIAAGLCGHCGLRPTDGEHSTCGECLAKYETLNEKRKQRLEAAGLCQKCGEQPCEPGRTYCAADLQYFAEKRRKERNTARTTCEGKPEIGGKPRGPGTTRVGGGQLTQLPGKAG